MSVPTVNVPSWSIVVLGPGGAAWACVGDPACAGGTGGAACGGGPGGPGDPEGSCGAGAGGVEGSALTTPVDPAKPMRTAPAATIAAFFSTMKQQRTP